MFNLIVSIVVAIQLLVGQVKTIEAGIQENHQIWVEIYEPCFSSSVFDEDKTEFEDEWTTDKSIYWVLLSTGAEWLILAEDTNHAWDKVEKHLSEKQDFTTSILNIRNDEVNEPKVTKI
jgi:hypothetical protein